MKETRFKQTEIGLIPEDWSYGVFADFLKTFTTGATPLRSIKSYYEGNIKWVSSGELNYRTIYDTIEHITESAAKNTNLKIHEKGTFLMAITGLEAEGTRGKCAILGTEATTNQSCLAINSTSKMMAEYLYYYYRLNSDLLAFKYCQGSKQQSYTAEIVKKLPIYCPKDIIEQKKIASALTSIDNLLLSLEMQIEKKRLIKQGAMQELLTGKKKLPGFTGKWVEKRLGEITEMNSGGTPSVNVKEYYGNEIPFLSISDMSWQGKYLRQTEKSITYLGLKNSSARIFPSGTILYVMYASIGKCSIAKIELAISQAVLGIKVNKEVLNNIYLYYYLSFIENKAKEIGQQGTQSNLSKQIVEKIKILLPPLEEQKSIAKVLSSMDKEIESLECKKAKYEQIKQGMMQQLLTGKIRLI